MQRRLAAILAADVVGFSRLSEQDEEGTLDRLDAIRQGIVDPNVARSGGRIVKLIGDGILVEFPSVVDAVRCALTIQRESSRENSKLPAHQRIVFRIGINLGDVIVKGDDLYGDGVNVAARLEKLAEPGGIAISATVRDHIERRVDAPFESMGLQQLKNINRLVHVWHWAETAENNGQSGQKRKRKGLSSGPAPPNNLPVHLSLFVGRSDELTDIHGLLSGARLLTLTGAGGCGKTRLACQLGAQVLDSFPDGVWFVALASLRDPVLLVQTVATVLGVREQPGRPLTETIQSYLAPKTALLILDNCEHLVGDCAQLAEYLLLSCPGLKIVATSRETLGIIGEHVHLVPGLEVPARGERHSFEALTRFEAIQLFADRASQRSRTFSLTQANAGIVARICTRLDGIPLAIELAAARVRILSVHQIAERLDDAFRLLGETHHTGLPHHQTLRLAMDWSYSLLTDAEKSLFRRLSVFAGRFSLDAVKAVCAGEDDLDFDLLDLLQHLAEKSMVVAEDHDTQARYWLLETLRQYGHSKLDGDTELDTVRDRHVRYFLSLSEAAEPNIQGSGSNKAQAEWLDRLEADYDNLRIALEYGKTAGRESSGVALAGALWRFWEVRGYLSEGREAVRSVLATGDDTPPAYRAKALDGEGRLAWRQGDFQDAHACFDESLALWRTAGDAAGEANSLHGLARTALNLGDFSTAENSANASLEIHREIRNEQGVASALNTLGEVARAKEDFAAAEVKYREALAIFRRVGDIAASVSVLHNLGYTFLNRGEIEDAGANFREALTTARDLNDRLGIFSMLGGLACVAAAAGHAELAVELFGAADSAGKDWGYAGDRIDQNEVKRWLQTARSASGDKLASSAWERGQEMGFDAAISLALD